MYALSLKRTVLLIVNIRGIDYHRCTNIEIGTVSGVIQTHKGPVIGIFNQYALLNKGSSIRSLCQFEWYKNDVNDKSFLFPEGLQHNQTLDGYSIPLSIQDGLTRLKIRPYPDQEFETFPHVMMTSELEWDPSVLDHEFKEDEQWGDIPTIPSSFDDVGDYKHDISESDTFNHIIYNLKPKLYETTLAMVKRAMNDPSHVPNLNNLKRDIRQIYTNS
jgi:hypothetical protein